MDAVFCKAAAVVGNPGGELPGRPMPTCCCGVAMGSMGGCVMAATDPDDVGRREAMGPIVTAACGTLMVGPVIMTWWRKIVGGASDRDVSWSVVSSIAELRGDSDSPQRSE